MKRPASSMTDELDKPNIKRQKSARGRPKGIKNGQKLEKLDANAYIQEFKTGGKIFTCGQGDVGQLGLGEDIMEKSRFTVVPDCFDIVAVAAGGMHNVCLTKDGKVITFGCNDEGALGRSTTVEGSETIPGMVDLPLPAKQVTAGDSHSAALLDDGRVFVWGTFRDSHGVMGLLTQSKNEQNPVEILSGTKFVKIASGADHLVLLDDNRRVYTCGCAEQGQLGRISERSSDRDNRKGMKQLLVPGLISVGKPSQKVEVDNIWAGTYATFVKDNKDNMYVCGLNNYYQIGLKNTEKQYHPELSSTLSKKKWVQISSGQHHTIGVDAEGKVYVIGRKEYGRLGLGDVDTDAIEVTPVPLLENLKCIDVAAGSAQSFTVTETGKLYAWGMGTTSQLGTGEEEDVIVPTLIDSKQLKEIKVFQVSGGGQHTTILGSPIIMNGYQAPRELEPSLQKCKKLPGGTDYRYAY